MATPEEPEKTTINTLPPFSFRELFSLKENTNYGGTIETIRGDIEFRNGNIWALILAILIASVGLNTNSTAVIIGAMLISPLMGPIVGIGFGLGTNHFLLLHRSLRNLLIMTITALVASTLYFTLSPLAEVQSELLARTRPTLYDVLIAFFGGSAGIIAVSRKVPKANILSGVAIATALMPPLCTAGFGLAQHNFSFFLGAMHLFLINALFICLATLLFVRLMNFHQKEINPLHKLRTRLILGTLFFAIVIPSSLTGFRVVKEAHFTQKAQRFINAHISSPSRVVVKSEILHGIGKESSEIRVTLVGEEITPAIERDLQAKSREAGLGDTKLTIVQPGLTKMMTLLDEVRSQKNSQIDYALYASKEEQVRHLEKQLKELQRDTLPFTSVQKELKLLFPTLTRIGGGREIVLDSSDSTLGLVIMAEWKKAPQAEEQKKLEEYTRLKLPGKKVRFIQRVSK